MVHEAQTVTQFAGSLALLTLPVWSRFYASVGQSICLSDCLYRDLRLRVMLEVTIDCTAARRANAGEYDTIRYDTRCYFNVRSKADISQLNLPHGTDN